MKFLFIFYLISYMSGFSSISLLALFYFKYKIQPLKKLILCDIYFCFILILDTLNLYFNYLDAENYKDIKEIIIIFGLFFSNVGLVYSFLKLVLNFIGKEFCKSHKLILGLTSSITLIFIVVLLISYEEGRIAGEIAARSAYTGITLYSGIWQLFCASLLYLRLKTLDGKLKPPMITVIALVFFFIPISLFSELIQYKIDFGMPAAYSPMTFLLFNTAAIVFTYRYFSVEQEEKGLSGQLSSKLDEDTLHSLAKNKNITDREMEILLLVIDGHTNQEIGNKLFISANTVRNHIYNIFRKMGAKSRYELIKCFISHENGVTSQQ